ncbi:MAG: DUF1015 family protein [candidate division KSB1 bacterium]|nr:DUF1015 family protein [candidate division KSB1 bacterium]
MAIIKPFKGLRPNPALVEQVASPPYDVLDRQQAQTLAQNNPHSFLHIIKPEIDLETDDPEQIYQQGRKALEQFRQHYILLKEDSPCLYLYRQTMGEHEQTGFVGCVSVQEYKDQVIKKHEHTRPSKVQDRVQLISACKAQTGPVFLSYRQTDQLASLKHKLLDKCDKVYDFTSYNQVRHQFYKIEEPFVRQAQNAFDPLPALYIADGHHRSEAAAAYCDTQPDCGSGDQPYNYFLAVIFPETELYIMAYNRVVKDLNGMNADEFMQRLSKIFDVEPISVTFDGPGQKHQFGVYIKGSWHLLTVKSEQINPEDPVQSLDVALLQQHVLTPILGIDDPRTNPRIDFVGGISGTRELERRVDSGEHQVAFSLYPTSMQEIMQVADAGKVMPPKSTWFEPKLFSGMVTHLLE